MILASHGIIASQIASFDADAVAFFTRVTTAGGTLSTTEKQAVNQLVLDLKANSLWTPMKAIYPMVGASAAACAQNLKSSSFTGTFTSGWTFASTGVTPNGTSAYMDSTLIPNTSLTLNNTHLSIYSRTNTASQSRGDMGAYTSTALDALTLATAFGNISYMGAYSFALLGNYIQFANTDSRGFYLNTRISSTSLKGFKNSTLSATVTNTSGSLTNKSIYIGAENNNGTGASFSNREYAFASIGDGLTDTQASNFYTAVQAFQTTLSRQV
jgi:hypothetical protein